MSRRGSEDAATGKAPPAQRRIFRRSHGLAAGAGAVHLGRDDLDAAAARAILGSAACIGGTVHSPEQIRRLTLSAVDYLGVGPVFGTRSKANPAPVLGLDALRAIAASSSLPVIAIGNITAERVADVLSTGAHGVAVLSAVTPYRRSRPLRAS